MLPNVEGSGKTKEQVALFFGALLKCICDVQFTVKQDQTLSL